jgi:hypothetical protein
VHSFGKDFTDHPPKGARASKTVLPYIVTGLQSNHASEPVQERHCFKEHPIKAEQKNSKNISLKTSQKIEQVDRIIHKKIRHKVIFKIICSRFLMEAKNLC